jgi:DUF1680 family protein
VAAVADEGLRIYQYADADIRTTLADGRPVAVTVATEYPEHGTVVVTVAESAGDPWTLTLRVPAWAAGATVTVNGAVHPVGDGEVRIHRAFAPGDEVRLELPMAARFTHPDPRIDAVRGCVAVEKGPLVLCAEAADGEPDLDVIRVDTGADPRTNGDVTVVALIEKPAPAVWPYAATVPGGPRTPATLRLVPYHRWGRRGPVTMRVWLPTA